MELYLELFLFSLMNMKVLESDSTNEWIDASNKVALASLVLVIAVPFIIIIYFFR